MADESKVDDLIDHLDQQTQEMKNHLLANKAQAAEALETELPAADQATISHGLGQAVGGIIGGAGEIVGGVASAGADAVAGVGSVADAVHTGVNNFFSGLRKHLGI